MDMPSQLDKQINPTHNEVARILGYSDAREFVKKCSEFKNFVKFLELVEDRQLRKIALEKERLKAN